MFSTQHTHGEQPRLPSTNCLEETALTTRALAETVPSQITAVPNAKLDSAKLSFLPETSRPYIYIFNTILGFLLACIGVAWAIKSYNVALDANTSAKELAGTANKLATSANDYAHSANSIASDAIDLDLLSNLVQLCLDNDSASLIGNRPCESYISSFNSMLTKTLPSLSPLQPVWSPIRPQPVPPTTSNSNSTTPTESIPSVSFPNLPLTTVSVPASVVPTFSNVLSGPLQPTGWSTSTTHLPPVNSKPPENGPPPGAEQPSDGNGGIGFSTLTLSSTGLSIGIIHPNISHTDTVMAPTDITPTSSIPTNLLPTGIFPPNISQTNTDMISTDIIPTRMVSTGIFPSGLLPNGSVPTDIIPPDLLPTGGISTDIIPTSILPIDPGGDDITTFSPSRISSSFSPLSPGPLESATLPAVLSSLLLGPSESVTTSGVTVTSWDAPDPTVLPGISDLPSQGPTGSGISLPNISITIELSTPLPGDPGSPPSLTSYQGTTLSSSISLPSVSSSENTMSAPTCQIPVLTTYGEGSGITASAVPKPGSLPSIEGPSSTPNISFGGIIGIIVGIYLLGCCILAFTLYKLYQRRRSMLLEAKKAQRQSAA